MKALIKLNAARYGNQRGDKSTHEFLLTNRGKFVEIDTKNLFDNQYNAEGFRIYDNDIERIEDDARIGLGRCNYCGQVAKECEEHKEYFKPFDDAFFIKNPNGVDAIKEVNINVDHKQEGYYSFYSVNGLYYRISRRSNIEFVLVGGVPYLVGIGYTHYKKAKLTNGEIKILEKVIEKYF
jgi:hypothetical protein